VDGLITNVPGLVLTTYYADCVPLYFIDPVKRAIGLSHSGWRGTVQKMVAVTLQRMQETYGCDLADLYAAIGPSICQDCYEVSEDVIEAFRENYKEQYWPGLFYKKENGRYQLNLWEANRIVLMEAGIRPERISLPNLCTCCNPEFLFSHRASKGKRGNLAAFLAIQP
jgi:YfiH family protein